MRNAYFGLLLIGFLSIASASELRAQSTSSTAPPPLLAAPAPTPQIYYLTQHVGVTTHDGVQGFEAGTQVTIVGEKDTEDWQGKKIIYRAKIGDLEFDVKADQVTNDFKIAMRAWETYRAQQEQLTAQAAAAQQQQAAQAHQRQIAEAAQRAQQEREAAAHAQQASARQAEDESGPARRAETQEIQARYERMLRNTRIMRAAEDHAQGQTQADLDAIMAEGRARDRIQHLEDQEREVKRDEMYEYNKAASERGNSAAEQVRQSYDSKVRDLDSKINDLRNEQNLPGR